MTKHHAGMIISQKAIDWWPYIGTIVGRINKAVDTMNIEVLDEIFLDAANIVEKRRKVTTVAGLNQELNKKLRWYKGRVKEIAAKKKALKTGVGVRGKPVTESALKQYRSNMAWVLQQRNEQKQEIRRLAKTIKNFSPHRGKIVVRGNVPLKVFYGGKYPAELEVEYKQGWQRIR